LGEVESIKKTIEGLRKVFDGYKGSTKLLIENSAGSGSVIGSDFEEIGKILKGTKNPHLAGICLDTQHSFASGYNWKDNFEENIKTLDKTIGIKNIKLIHANDSMSECGSHVDRHEHIGHGKIGLEGFKKLVAFAKENNIDMICETKSPGVADDIKKIKELRG
jgi:deoxyribonuclease-4